MCVRCGDVSHACSTVLLLPVSGATASSTVLIYSTATLLGRRTKDPSTTLEISLLYTPCKAFSRTRLCDLPDLTMPLGAGEA